MDRNDIPMVYRHALYALANVEKAPAGMGFVLIPGIVDGVEKILVCAFVKSARDPEKIVPLPIFQGVDPKAVIEIQGIEPLSLSSYTERLKESTDEAVHRDTM